MESKRQVPQLLLKGHHSSRITSSAESPPIAPKLHYVPRTMAFYQALSRLGLNDVLLTCPRKLSAESCILFLNASASSLTIAIRSWSKLMSLQTTSVRLDSLDDRGESVFSLLYIFHVLSPISILYSISTHEIRVSLRKSVSWRIVSYNIPAWRDRFDLPMRTWDRTNLWERLSNLGESTIKRISRSLLLAHHQTRTKASRRCFWPAFFHWA